MLKGVPICPQYLLIFHVLLVWVRNMQLTEHIEHKNIILISSFVQSSNAVFYHTYNPLTFFRFLCQFLIERSPVTTSQTKPAVADRLPNIVMIIFELSRSRSYTSNNSPEKRKNKGSIYLFPDCFGLTDWLQFSQSSKDMIMFYLLH